MVVECAIRVELEPLGLVPDDLCHILGHQRIETHDHFLVGALFRNQVPGIAKIAIHTEPLRDLIVIVEGFQLANPTDVKGSRVTMKRRPADHIPASPAEQEPVGLQSCADFAVFAEARIGDPHTSTLANCREQLFIHRLLAGEAIRRGKLNRDRLTRQSEVLSQAVGKVAGQFEGRAAGRFEKGQLGSASYIVAEDQQGQGFLLREVRRRQKVGPRNAIPLLYFIVQQRYADLS